MPENYLEKALLKLARQINAYDEASLIDLFDKYAEQVQAFEPTKRWEEAALILGIVQGMRLKNQLFNYHFAQARIPPKDGGLDFAALTAPAPDAPGRQDDRPPPGENRPSRQTAGGKAKGGKLLKLTPRKRQ